jgi:hypothetical protein
LTFSFLFSILFDQGLTDRTAASKSLANLPVCRAPSVVLIPDTIRERKQRKHREIQGSFATTFEGVQADVTIVLDKSSFSAAIQNYSNFGRKLTQRVFRDCHTPRSKRDCCHPLMLKVSWHFERRRKLKVLSKDTGSAGKSYSMSCEPGSDRM